RALDMGGVGQSAQGRGAQRRPDRGMPDQSQADRGQEESSVTAGEGVMAGARGSLALWALGACIAFSAFAATAQTALPDLPPEIAPGDLKSYLSVPAKGVQIYVCSKTDNGF